MSSIYSCSDEQICVLCKKEFKDPRILPCLHTFCSGCIENMDSFEMTRNTSRNMDTDSFVASIKSGLLGLENLSKIGTKKISILCPICDTEVQIPNSIELLPINHIIRNKLCIKDLINRCADAKCEKCTVAVKAIARCNSCHINLCEKCTDTHQNHKIMSGHPIMSLEEICQLEPLKCVKTKLYCQIHPFEELKQYCQQCQTLICRDCSINEHKSHMTDIPEYIADAYRIDIRDSLEKIAPLKDLIQNALNIVQETKNMITKKAFDIENEVNLFVDRYMAALEVFRNKILNDLDSICDRRIKQLKLQKVILQQNLNDLSHAYRFGNELLETSSDSELMATNKCILNRLNTLTNDSYKTEPVVTSQLTFDPKYEGEPVQGFRIFGAVVPSELDPMKCQINEEVLATGRVFHHTELELSLRDQDNYPFDRSNDDRVKVTVEHTDGIKEDIPVKISPKKNDSYCLSFTPNETGNFKLSVMLNDVHIKNSPFQLNIKSRRRGHLGIFHCCTFCSSNGRKDIACGCGGTMPGGFKGCGHGHLGHPGKKHWSCCGKLSVNAECVRTHRGKPQQFTL